MSTSSRSYAWSIVAAVLAAFVGALLLALPTNPPTSDAFAQDPGKKPAKDQAAKKDDAWPINDDVDDPAVWGRVFPLHYELYKKTVDMHRTKYGGSEAMPRAPTQADPRSIVSRTKVDEDIGLKTMWQGYAFPGEFFVFVFFGLVATVGSCFLQTGQFSWASAAAGGMIGALAAAVLVVNNYRDLESDRRSAKITLAVRVGYVATRLEFAALVLLPFAALPLLAVLTGTGLWMLLPLASAPIAVRLIRDLVRAPISPALNPLLKRTARLEFVFGLLVCAALAL